jgi:hypothetical protein
LAFYILHVQLQSFTKILCTSVSKVYELQDIYSIWLLSTGPGHVVIRSRGKFTSFKTKLKLWLRLTAAAWGMFEDWGTVPHILYISILWICLSVFLLRPFCTRGNGPLGLGKGLSASQFRSGLRCEEERGYWERKPCLSVTISYCSNPDLLKE